VSSEPHKIVIRLESGSIRIGISPQLARPTRLQVYTQQALTQMTEGSTLIEANSQESQITVREGQARVKALVDDSEVLLNPAERVAVPTGNGVTDVMPAARNLLPGYSDFRQPLGVVWRTYIIPPQYEGESPGIAINVNTEGRPAVEFSRDGTGFAETGIRQELNLYIRDLRSLKLRIELRVLQQDVPMCGQAGTECPVMVRIDYEDEEGSLRSWLQGFYYLPDPDPNTRNPNFCNTCNPRNPHIHVTNGVWLPYESDNLIPTLTQVASPPVYLKSISIYASGHKYQSQVSEVALLGE
jgi:hypothetical protein